MMTPDRLKMTKKELIKDLKDSIDNHKCRLITLNWEVRNYKGQTAYINSMKEMIKDTKKDIAKYESKIEELENK